MNDIKQLNRNDLNDIRKMIESFLDSLTNLAKQKLINKRQEQLLALINNLIKLMREIKIKDKKESNLTFSINELVMKKHEIFLLLLLDNNRIEFEFEAQGQMLMDSVLSLDV